VRASPGMAFNEDDKGVAARYLLLDLPKETQEEDLLLHFGAFGEIEEVTLKRHPETGEIRASVKFANPTLELRGHMLNRTHEIRGGKVTVQTWKMQKLARPGFKAALKGGKFSKGYAADYSPMPMAGKGWAPAHGPGPGAAWGVWPDESDDWSGWAKGSPSSWRFGSSEWGGKYGPLESGPRPGGYGCGNNGYGKGPYGCGPYGTGPSVWGPPGCKGCGKLACGKPACAAYGPAGGKCGFYAAGRGDAYASGKGGAWSSGCGRDWDGPIPAWNGPLGQSAWQVGHTQAFSGKGGPFWDKDKDITARYLLTGLSLDTEEEDLRRYFGTFGEIEEVTLRSHGEHGETMSGSVKFLNPTMELRRLMLNETHEIRDTQITVQTWKMRKLQRPSYKAAGKGGKAGGCPQAAEVDVDAQAVAEWEKMLQASGGTDTEVDWSGWPGDGFGSGPQSRPQQGYRLLPGGRVQNRPSPYGGQ